MDIIERSAERTTRRVVWLRVASVVMAMILHRTAGPSKEVFTV
jgi:hypothetical protein